MSNEIVKYKNKLNSLNLSDLNSGEFNLFIAIISRLRDKEDKKITFTREELIRLSGLSVSNKKSKERFNTYMDTTSDKVFDQTLKYISETGSREGIHLFNKFSRAKDFSTLTIQASNEGLEFFNDLTENFTRFSLQQFTKLRSKYSKTMFMLLKQYRTTGIKRIKKEDFYTIMGIPPKYKSGNVDQKVINPIKKELAPLFRNLKFAKVKHHNRVVGYKITFIKEDPNKNDFDYSKSADNEWKYFDTDSDIITHYKEHKEIQAKQELAKQKARELKEKVKQVGVIAKESSDWVDLETLNS